jgi:hypothetical protein
MPQLPKPYTYYRFTPQTAINASETEYFGMHLVSFGMSVGNFAWKIMPLGSSVDFNAGKQVILTQLFMQPCWGISRAPSAFTVSGSNDMQTWTVIHQEQGLTPDHYYAPEQWIPFIIGTPKAESGPVPTALSAPVPVSGTFSARYARHAIIVTIPGQPATDTKIEIVDVAGRCVYRDTARYRELIAVPFARPSGYYVVQVVSGARTFRKALIVTE